MSASEGEVVEADIADVPATFDESVILLDVREDDEWQRGHAPGAQHIPMGDVPARIGEVDTEAKLFVVCHAGGRSHAGFAVPGPQRLRARSTSAAGCSPGRVRADPSSPTTAPRAPSENRRLVDVIQVCSRCGTRWNVRDRQRVWCPRCNGTLLAPSATAPDQQWSQHLSAPRRPGRRAHRHAAAAGIPMDRRSAGCAAAAAARRAPALGPTPALRDDSAVGPAGPHRARRSGSGARGADRTVGALRAHHAGRHDGAASDSRPSCTSCATCCC